MNKEERELIKLARDDMDDNPVSKAMFKIQSIVEDVYQQGIRVGETIGAAKAVFEMERKVIEVEKPKRKSCKKTDKGEE